jgi:hypothetical protein
MTYTSRYNIRELGELVGMVFHTVEVIDDKYRVMFKNAEDTYYLEHHQDCCESVSVEDVIGDLGDLADTPILEARRETSTNRDENPIPSPRPDPYSKYEPDSYTWTFFIFRTIKGSVTIRFFGESNGYYSEDADLYKEDTDGK